MSYKPMSIDELDDIARRFIDGNIDAKKIADLNILDRLLTIELSFIYSCTKLGVLSANSCAGFKYRFLNEHRMFKTSFEFLYKFRELQQMACRKSREIEKEIVKCLTEEKVDLRKLSRLQAECIDLLTSENIYIKLWDKADRTNNLCSETLSELDKKGEFLFDKYGEVPYIDMLMQFYKSQLDDGREMWQQLTGEDFRTKARCVPVKDEKSAGALKSIKTYYENKN